jgi:bifunctional non-homologous end joining protein LigD
VTDVRVRITHPERVLWPATANEPPITRRDLLRYFVQTADYLLAYMRHRPLTLLRYPYGLGGEKHFFQKHVEFEAPPFVDRESLISEHTGLDGTYLFCNNLATLLWLAQIANIELHTWYSRTDNEPDALGLPHTFGGSVEAFERSVLNYPDFMVFDLDPYVYSGDEPPGGQPQLHTEGFQRTCEVALWLKEVLDDLGLPAFVKTSGKTGLHVFVPVLRQFDYDTVRGMSEQICRFVQRQHPRETTMEWSVEKRRGKIFLDHNQNTRGKTLATPYSPRALPGAPVSMPVRWSELPDVYPSQFTLRTAHKRLSEVGDLWRDILDHKADLAQVFKAS